MTKFDNYIYYSICEKTIELEKQTVYRSYLSFCEGVKNSMLMESFGRGEANILYQLNDYLRLMYGFDCGTANNYIVDYFMGEKWIIFEKPVKLIMEYFPNSFD